MGGNRPRVHGDGGAESNRSSQREHAPPEKCLRQTQCVLRRRCLCAIGSFRCCGGGERERTHHGRRYVYNGARCDRRRCLCQGEECARHGERIKEHGDPLRHCPVAGDLRRRGRGNCRKCSRYSDSTREYSKPHPRHLSKCLRRLCLCQRHSGDGAGREEYHQHQRRHLPRRHLCRRCECGERCRLRRNRAG